MDDKALELQRTVREELIKRFYFLTVKSWPVDEHELILPGEADRLLHEAHEKAFTKICRLAETDEEAERFKTRVYGSITKPYGVKYDSNDVIRAACNLAPPFLRKLENDRKAAQDEVQHDPIGHTQREYLKARSEFDPFCDNANLAVGGLAVPKTQVRIDPMDGSVINEF